MPDTQNTALSKDAQLLYEGKELTKYVPKGQSPKLYIDLIKSQVMKPAANGTPRSDADLLMFLYVANRTGLDPLMKQIYAVFRWDYRQGKDVMSIQTGIDGMRLVAQRTGTYAGQEDIKFTPEDEVSKYPVKATCTVYKIIKGTRVAFSATARWAEYAIFNTSKEGGQKLSPMWEKMPYTMLGKCAEALALRKGFPNELSGVYAEEELAQANNPISDLPAPEKPGKIEVLHGAPTNAGPTIGAPTENSQTGGIPEGPKTDGAGGLTTPVDLPNPETKVVSVEKMTTKITEMRNRIKEQKEEEKK